MTKIVVVGSYVTDLSSRTPHMPKPGETVLGGPFTMGPGGKGCNQAVSARRQGAEVTMITRVGKDTFGELAIQNFSNEGINTDHIKVDENEATGTALILVDPSSENMIVVSLAACGKITAADVKQAAKEFEEADMILVQLETSVEAIAETIKLSAQLNKPIILNPAPYQDFPKELLAHITYITPNETEAFLLTGVEVVDEASALQAAKKLVELGVENALITLGKKGCFLYNASEYANGLLIDGFKVNAVDTTGAGDAFNGAFATFISQNLPVVEAAKKANAVAALSVTKVGTAPAMPSIEDVEKLLAFK